MSNTPSSISLNTQLLAKSTGLENVSNSDLEILIQQDSDIFGKPVRERNRRMFQNTSPLLNSLSIEMNKVWNNILSIIPFAVMSIEANNVIKLELNEITFRLTPSKAFTSKIQLKVVFEGFSSTTSLYQSEIPSYLETILEDTKIEDNEPTEEEKQTYCYYQSLEIREAMAGLSDIDSYYSRF